MGETLEQRRTSVAQQLTGIGLFRLGSLFYRTRRCGKANCACADPKHPGHGHWILEKRAGGRPVMTTVPEPALAQVREQLKEGQRYWRLCEQFAESSDELAKSLLKQEQAAAQATAKKGASKKLSRRKSSPRSTR